MSASENNVARPGLRLVLIALTALSLACSEGDSGSHSSLKAAPSAARQAAHERDERDDSAPHRVSDDIAELQALGYVDWIKPAEENEGKQGVTLHLPELASPGYNLFSSRPRNHAVLVDMDGRVRPARRPS